MQLTSLGKEAERNSCLSFWWLKPRTETTSRLHPNSTMIVEAFLWALMGASASLSLVIPQKLVRVYPHQTAFLRVSLQFQQPEWKFFHVKWKFLTKNCSVLYYAVECNTGSSTANRTCKRTVEKQGLYEARVDIEEDGSLVLRDVKPEDAGKYEIHVLALDLSVRAEVELVVLEGLPLSESISMPPSAVSAAVNHTAWLPINLQPLGHAWTFLSIKWELVTTNGSISVLVYLIDNCNRTILEWWEKECTVNKEVAGKYQQRVDIFRNGTLVIYSVGFKDAGIYQATIRASGVKVQATVNLTVTQGKSSISVAGTSGGLHHENAARIILAGLLLCFLGLLVGEHVWATISPRFTSQPRKGVETQCDWD